MKNVHLRFDKNEGEHTSMTIFIRFSNDEGKRRAEELARIYCAALKNLPNYNGGVL